MRPSNLSCHVQTPAMDIIFGSALIPNSTSSQRTNTGSGRPAFSMRAVGIMENHHAPYAFGTSTEVSSLETTASMEVMSKSGLIRRYVPSTQTSATSSNWTFGSSFLNIAPLSTPRSRYSPCDRAATAYALLIASGRTRTSSSMSKTCE